MIQTVRHQSFLATGAIRRLLELVSAPQRSHYLSPPATPPPGNNGSIITHYRPCNDGDSLYGLGVMQTPAAGEGCCAGGGQRENSTGNNINVALQKEAKTKIFHNVSNNSPASARTAGFPPDQLWPAAAMQAPADRMGRGRMGHLASRENGRILAKEPPPSHTAYWSKQGTGQNGSTARSMACWPAHATSSLGPAAGPPLEGLEPQQ